MSAVTIERYRYQSASSWQNRFDASREVSSADGEMPLNDFAWSGSSRGAEQIQFLRF